MKTLQDYIVVMDDLVPHELINALLAEYKDGDDWVTARIGAGQAEDIRRCSTIGVSFDRIIEKNKEARQKIDHDLFQVVGKALGHYAEKCRYVPDGYFPKEDTGYELLRYDTGGFYVQHVDYFKEIPRVVSCSFALNDDYTGGEFAFFDRELKYSLKKGSCIMFPANFMYAHEIMPVLSGTRYSLVTWFI